MTFSRCLRCDATFSSYKRGEHQCNNDQRKDQPHG